MAISDPVSMTSRWVAAARAVESRRPDRLFNDPYAEVLAGSEGFDFMARMASATAMPSLDGTNPENPYIAMRTRFIDDVILDASLKGTRQIVMVAAGLDTRAFRLDLPGDTHFFELDREEVLEFKESVLREAGARATCVREPIPVDLTTPFGDALVARGFRPESESLWVVEGLLSYLDEDQATEVIRQCAALAAPGSMLICDLPGRSLLETGFVQPLLRTLEAVNAPWKFGTDDPESFFEKLGWHATARRPGDAGVSYGRWPYPPMPRNTPGIPQSFFVTAVRI
ncbi:MAG TPA: SAM-dependent methyltransferase [Candidatus Kapabacteria bacterium]|nr:SAM-dependent methyltransferase [Candidatus Kapabacteria bacterium]